jgi:hypothetical protein
MVGHPKHVTKALAQGVDIICAQGGEGGGHTGTTPTSILIPACVDLCKGKKSPLTGGPVSACSTAALPSEVKLISRSTSSLLEVFTTVEVSLPCSCTVPRLYGSVPDLSPVQRPEPQRSTRICQSNVIPVKATPADH